MTPSILFLLLALGLRPSGPQADGVGARVGSSPVDSARAELQVGRHWHAARILRRHAESEKLGPSESLLLAEAEAGWGRWSAALSILDGADWLDTLEDGRGRFLHARALDKLGRWSEAATSYASYERTAAGRPALVSGLRRAMAMARAGLPGAPQTLEELSILDPAAASWVALEMSRRAAAAGRVEAVLAFRPALVDPDARSRAWNLEARAYLAAGDTAAAVATYQGMLGDLSGARRAAALQNVAELELAAGDTVAALGSAARSFVARSTGGSAARAARLLLDLGYPSPRDALAFTEALQAAGDERRALRALEIHLGSYQEARPPAELLLARGRLLAAVGRQEEAVEQFRRLEPSAEGEFELDLLREWRAARRSQGRRDAARTIDNWIVERFPESPEAVDVVFFRADRLHDRGDLEGAAREYGRAADMAPTLDRAGLARMRLGQVHLAQDDLEGAAEAFEQYVEAVPEGAYWDEAAYWAARTRIELGSPEVARGYLDLLLRRFPLSYYAVLAAELEGGPFTVDLPEGSAPVAPDWLAGGLETLDLLSEAGLEEGATAQVGRLVARSDESPDAMFALAEALLERGLTIEAIRLGWRVRASDHPLDRRLLRVIFPFPYRDIIEREAAERGLDPIFLAALIRQESAFSAPIRSHAGAVGLMQVMPSTGRQLARAEGIRGFTSAHLSSPEINTHLGARFYVDMVSRFGEDNLPLVLTAYNAGPGRANQWRAFPEASDPSRFIERIPFTETRGYVKSVLRYRALYGALYGDESE